MIKSNCHTHSTYCDGKNTLEEMVLAAIEKKFTSLGFSGHSPMNFNSDWAMSLSDYEKYLNEVRRLKNKYKDKIDIVCGIELDADFDGINQADLEYIICSVHQFRKGEKDYPIDCSAKVLSNAVTELFDGDWYAMCESYYNRLGDFVCEINPQIVGHIDLVTKFNENNELFDQNNPTYRKCVLDTIDRILKYNKDIVFEVNTGAMYRQGNKIPYPAAFIMEHLKDRGARITVTSDSHCIDSLDFAFDEAYSYCRKFGYRNIYIMTSDGWKEIEI